MSSKQIQENFGTDIIQNTGKQGQNTSYVGRSQPEDILKMPTKKVLSVDLLWYIRMAEK